MSNEDLTKTQTEAEAEGEQLYKPPPEKSLIEIVKADQDDESLRKYKETLLGRATRDEIVVEPDNPGRVIVKSLTLVVDGRDDIVLDLTGNLDELKKKVFKVKEGIQYKVRIGFIVQREIVTGLKYIQKIYKCGIQVEKMSQMVGSYAPQYDQHVYTSPIEEMPSGMLARGAYTVKSLFTDDDKKEHLKWEWTLDLRKDWD